MNTQGEGDVAQGKSDSDPGQRVQARDPGLQATCKGGATLHQPMLSSPKLGCRRVGPRTKGRGGRTALLLAHPGAEPFLHTHLTWQSTLGLQGACWGPAKARMIVHPLLLLTTSGVASRLPPALPPAPFSSSQPLNAGEHWSSHRSLNRNMVGTHRVAWPLHSPDLGSHRHSARL